MSAPQKALATRRQGHNDTADALQQPAPDQAALPPGSTSAVVSGQPPAPNAIRVIDVRDREAWRKSYYGTIGYRVVTGAEWLQLMLPQLMTVLVILILIFGGCCSNVSRLSGLLESELTGAPSSSPMEPKRTCSLTCVLVVEYLGSDLGGDNQVSCVRVKRHSGLRRVDNVDFSPEPESGNSSSQLPSTQTRPRLTASQGF